jgi:hypothetical protein
MWALLGVGTRTFPPWIGLAVDGCWAWYRPGLATSFLVWIRVCGCHKGAFPLFTTHLWIAALASVDFGGASQSSCIEQPCNLTTTGGVPSTLELWGIYCSAL